LTNCFSRNSFILITIRVAGGGGYGKQNFLTRESALSLAASSGTLARVCGLKLALLDRHAHRIQSSDAGGPGGRDARHLAALSVSSWRGDGECGHHPLR